MLALIHRPCPADNQKHLQHAVNHRRIGQLGSIKTEITVAWKMNELEEISMKKKVVAVVIAALATGIIVAVKRKKKYAKAN